jgi:hypothetical protein
MFLVVGLQKLGYRVTEQERNEKRKEVKVQIQIIHGPGRLDSRMTEMEREEGKTK